MTDASKRSLQLRATLALGFVFIALGALAARAVYLQVLDSDFLQEQGNERSLRVVQDHAARGMILDRNGEPLAISTPIESVWAHPRVFAQSRRQWPTLAKALDLNVRDLAALTHKHAEREFMYLRRHVTPEVAARVRALKVPGVSLAREHRRYYPIGEVAGHVVGFTNIDDHGQEGMELAFDKTLQGVPGRTRVIKDRLGTVVETLESVRLPKPGRDLTLSLDKHIQYLAYRELKDAVARHHARGGSAVVLDTGTGEVLAMVNEPGFNPNNRPAGTREIFRNRVITDVFEPGSTLKPFTVAAALEAGVVSPGTMIDCVGGTLRVGSAIVHDTHDNGVLSVAQVVEKSSNVGVTKIAFAMQRETLWDTLHRAGFGKATGIGMQGEAGGVLRAAARWKPIEHATVAFGYGVSVTAIQLATAYTALANDGRLIPPTLVRRDSTAGPPAAREVFSARTARQLRDMLGLAVGSDGTGTQARVRYYHVAGKTGTAHKMVGGGYRNNQYISSFAGFAPATNPRLVMVVTIDEPSGGAYYGGLVAAPVFARVMSGALRLLDVPPDNADEAPPVIRSVSL